MNIYFVGRADKEKGVEEFSKLADELNDHTFYWYSYVVSAAIKSACKSVHFIEGLAGKELTKDIVGSKDLFVSCSHFEGFCLPVAEAMLLNIPVVAYKLPEIYDSFADNILYVNEGDVAQMEATVMGIIDKGLDSAMLVKAKKFVLDNYSPEVVSSKLLRSLKG